MDRAAISRVVILNDHPSYHRELKDLLERWLSICVAGEAETLEALLRLAEELAPDAVFVDITATRLEGIAALERIVAHRPDLPVIALSLYGDSQLCAKALSLGAAAFVTQGELVEQLPGALLKVMDRPDLPLEPEGESPHGSLSTRSSTLPFSSVVAVP